VQLCLRSVCQDDLVQTLKWHSDQELSRLTGGRRLPITEVDELAWYSGLSHCRDQAILIVDQGGEAVGLVGLYDIDWVARTARSGLMVDPQHQDAGVGTQAYSMLIDYAENSLGLRRLWAMIVVGNEASLRLHDRLGFEREGVLRQHWFVDGALADVNVVGRCTPAAGVVRQQDAP